MKVIERHSRITWDIFCFTVIVVSAFEIPYNILVGWGNPFVDNAFQTLFFVVFSLDIVLNCMTVRNKSYSGLWGWRNFGRFLRRKWAPEPERRRLRDVTFTTQPAVVLAYLTSGWFVIDLLAAIPYEWLLGGASFFGLSRVARFGRLARLVRLIRLAKAFRIFDQLNRVMRDHPALGRLFITACLVPWLAHIHACLLLMAESGNAASGVETYRDALNSIFICFTTNDQAPVVSLVGYWTSVSAVVLSIAFIGTAIGNLSALFTELDRERKNLTDDAQRWDTIILGWSSALFSVIEQLSSEKREAGGIVVMASPETEWMEAEARKYCTRDVSRSVTFRKGSTDSIKHIQDLNVHAARHVIILGYDTQLTRENGLRGSEEDPDVLDQHVLKALLACYQALGVGEDDDPEETVRIVAAVHSQASLDVLEHGLPETLRRRVRLDVVDAVDMVARLTSRSVAEPRSALVFQELLSYEGSGLQKGEDRSSEIYCVPVAPGQVGVPFEDCVAAYPEALPIGYVASGEVLLNPAPGSVESAYRFAEGDLIVALANTRRQVRWDGPAPIPGDGAAPTKSDRELKNVLVVGGGRKSQGVLRCLPEFLAPGSVVYTDQPTDAVDPRSCTFHQVDLSRPSSGQGREEGFAEDGVQVARTVDMGACGTILVLDDRADREQHDTRILMRLAAMYARQSIGQRDVSVVIELRDHRNLELARAFGDLVVVLSDELVGNYLVQLAEQPYRRQVYTELLEESGHEFHFRPALQYFRPGEDELSFRDIMVRARGFDEIAIGYILSEAGPLHLCPRDRRAQRRAAEYGDIAVLAKE